MGWINVVPPPPSLHNCPAPIPRIDEVGEGSTWECDTCSDQWLLSEWGWEGLPVWIRMGD